MPFTAAQTTSFFEDANQMSIPNATRLQLQTEGLDTIHDLLEFDDDTLKQITENLRRPGGRIPDPAPDAGANDTIPTPPFVFGAKSQKRLKIAVKAAKYYETTGREMTPGNMAWTNTLKNFAEHWVALCDRKKEDDPEVPKITQKLAVTKWSESFEDYLHRVIGIRTIPLAYVIRKDEDAPAVVPPLVQHQPYSADHGSVEAELIARATHTHAHFRDDNAKVYYLLEEATRTTSYTASIKPFQRRKDGRGAWKAIVDQYAGEDKWRAELKKQDDLLHTRKWKGNSNFSLERFVASHRNAHVSMTQCAQHVDFQLPNELTRVTYLLDAIECNDAPLQAAMALVRNDTGPEGKMNSFEDTASFLLPHDPVAKKRDTGRRTYASILSLQLKTGSGETGVEFRFYDPTEYKKLSPEQKSELRDYRNQQEEEGKGRQLSAEGKGKKKGRRGDSKKSNAESNKRMKRMISQAVAKQLKSSKDSTDGATDDDEEQLRDYILSAVSSAANEPKKDDSKSTASSATSNAPKSARFTTATIQSILKRTKI
jgi:flagellar hook-basal body complex protein FliE